ncbi:peptidyl-prolyl cis-trans isomerase, cyclophilin-type [Dictyocaulus viviparus]|uniref:Peptidyl-prolyl cis-trans isomerase, cyclophilin-type n=1 Tax=Dictyocaulus viviparus TaxID=29172 RepID=A0A0D8Y518_DICVI|nr:peptidyl-prolyl cis-trans isomerase, cyclophilin-type [Dictyocaulus viviparus]
MTSVLGILCEIIAPVTDMRSHTAIPYCVMDPWVFFEIGFPKGEPMDRIEMRLNRKASPKLVDNFIALCKGEGPRFEFGIQPSFQGAPLFTLDKARGIIVTGDYILRNGCGGRASDKNGIVQDVEVKCGPASAGSIVMLPVDTDPTVYSSIFCILTSDTSYIEGKVIGKVTKGLDTLQFIMWKYGDMNGIPKQYLVIQRCGQI